MKVGELNLVGYREWTESLGHDRESKIQQFQHNFTATLTSLASEINSFVLTYRYDSYIFLLDGVPISSFNSLMAKVRDISPVPVNLCVGFGNTLLEAERNCSYENILHGTYKDEKMVLAHFDLDGFSKKSFMLDAYLEVYHVYTKLFEFSREIGGLAYYFGGDNIGIFTGIDQIENIKNVVEDFGNIKVGIGIGSTPREAIKNAARALHTIRVYRDRKIEIADSKN